jgi:hypothetical protein
MSHSKPIVIAAWKGLALIVVLNTDRFLTLTAIVELLIVDGSLGIAGDHLLHARFDEVLVT